MLLEEHRAAVTIQKHVKRRAVEMAFHALRHSVVAAQKGIELGSGFMISFAHVSVYPMSYPLAGL